MTDGTTGIPVAPITEDDMNKLQSIFQRALDAIVSMSKLAGEVESLRQQVGQLTDDAERLRRVNAGLDESLYQARNQRLQLEKDLDIAQQQSVTANRERSDWQAKANQAEGVANSLTAKIDSITAERDKAQYEALELQDQLKKVSDKLASVHSALGILPAPEPTPAPPPSGSMVQPAPEPSYSPPTPEPVPAEPVTEPPKPRRYYDQWQPGSMWDDEKRSYYIED